MPFANNIEILESQRFVVIRYFVFYSCLWCSFSCTNSTKLHYPLPIYLQTSVTTILQTDTPTPITTYRNNTLVFRFIRKEVNCLTHLFAKLILALRRNQPIKKILGLIYFIIIYTNLHKKHPKHQLIHAQFLITGVINRKNSHH
jgi:hypothetical protein